MGSLQPSASHCVRPLTGCDGGHLDGPRHPSLLEMEVSK